MKQRIYSFIVTAMMMVGLVTAAAAPAGAINVFGACSGSAASSEVCKSKNDDSVGNLVQTIIGILSFVIGVVAVIMIIVGGIKYVLSNGDASQVKSAKDTILYAVIGLIVALLAYAIVNFVTKQFS